MQFDCIECLPDNVKAALDENGQKMWMDAFNKTVKKSKTKKAYRDAVFDAWQMVKNYEGCRYFSGMVSTEDLDRQNDVVEVNKAYERIAKHIERGGTMIDTHTNRTVGSFVYVEKVIGKTGKPGILAHSVIYQGEPYYDSVWDQIKRGQVCPTCKDVRKGFSIGGFALETRNSCDASGCHRDILDMSIHEISICQEPANPEALIQDVNMMAKSETEIKEQETVISKDLRADAPAVAQEQPQMQEQIPQEVSAEELKAYAKKLKDMQNTLKYYEKFAEQFDSFMEQAGLGRAKQGMEQPGAGVAKASATGCGCGAIDENIHTSVGEKSCPVDEKLYGDVKDPQVRDADVKFLENVDVEADESAKKDHGELMPGKPDLGKKETAKEGPAVETKVMEGFSNLKAVNKTSEKNGEYEYSLDVKDSPKTVTDNGDNDEKNMGKEGEELLMKDGKVEIPADLMPMFQEFLNEKGIKMQPEVENEEIEDTIEKYLYIDDDISEMDLKKLSDGTEFDFAQMMGKAAAQKLKLQSLDAKMKLAKSLKVADIEYLVDDNEVKKNLKN